MLPIKFQDNQPFVSGKKQRIDFQNSDHVCHLGFPIQTILAIFYLQVTPMLPTKFHVSLLFISGEETKNRFISYQNNLSFFDVQVTPMLLTRFKSTGLLDQEKQKIDFQDCRHGGHLGFWIKTISAVFDLQVTPMLPTRFQVNWPFGSGE